MDSSISLIFNDRQVSYIANDCSALLYFFKILIYILEVREKSDKEMFYSLVIPIGTQSQRHSQTIARNHQLSPKSSILQDEGPSLGPSPTAFLGH